MLNRRREKEELYELIHRLEYCSHRISFLEQNAKDLRDEKDLYDKEVYDQFRLDNTKTLCEVRVLQTETRNRLRELGVY